MDGRDLPKPCVINKQKFSVSVMKAGIFVGITSVFGILAIIGNCLVLYLVYRRHSLRNTSNFFLCSLALANLLAGLLLFPISNANVLLNVSVDCSSILEKLTQFLTVQLLVLTAMNICVVSIDRLIAVKWPLRYPSIMTPVTTRRIIQTIWFISIVFAIPFTSFCNPRFLLIYWLFVSVTTTFIPFLIVVYCYEVILKISSAQQQLPAIRLQQSINSRNQQSRNLRNRKAMKVFLAIMILLFFSFLPNLICMILSVIPFRKCPSIVQDILSNSEWCVGLLTLTPSLNPFIYGLRNQEFRSAFRIVICKDNHREPNTFRMVQQAT